MILSIMQPNFFPWLGFFHQVYKCEKFVFLDDVQYVRRSWNNRCKILTDTGLKTLTMPVKSKGKFKQNILEAEIDNSDNWRRKHLAIIYENYKRASQFNHIITFVEELFYNNQYARVSEFNIATIQKICNFLELDRQFFRSSDLGIQQKNSDRILKICQKMEGTIYFAGASSRSYLNLSDFSNNGISVDFQKIFCKHHKKGSTLSNIIETSIIHYLFNFEKIKILDFLENG